MKFELNENAIGQAINDAVSAAVAKGVTSWDIQNAVSAAATEAVKGADLPARVGAALTEVMGSEVDALVAEAVAEAMPALRAAVKTSISHMAARMLYGLHVGPNSYDEKQMQTWRDCIAKMEPKV